MPVQDTVAGSPRELFFHTPEQRIALARQKFFEEGVRPTGAVGEAVIQSWMRCLGARHQPGWRPQFEPVTPSRTHSALARSRELLEAARDDLGTMETSLAGTECRVFLNDGDGLLVHATPRPLLSYQPILRTARVGVNLAESLVGTTAPGVVAKTGQAVTVVAGEHFYESLSAVHCAAAPIRDAQGRVAGVLDVSVEGRAFGFHAASMVGLYATRIENRLLQMQSRDHLILRFQPDPSLLNTPLEGLAGVGPDGEVCWLNAVAARLLSASADAPGSAQALFGLRLQDLLALTRQVAPCVGRLPSGLGVWLLAQLQAPDGANFNHGLAMTRVPVAAPAEASDVGEAAPAPVPMATLDDSNMQIIRATLAECGGNISRAARKLGVSRGLLYRRLRPGTASAAEKLFQAGTGKSRG